MANDKKKECSQVTYNIGNARSPNFGFLSSFRTSMRLSGVSSPRQLLIRRFRSNYQMSESQGWDGEKAVHRERQMLNLTKRHRIQA